MEHSNALKELKKQWDDLGEGGKRFIGVPLREAIERCFQENNFSNPS